MTSEYFRDCIKNNIPFIYCKFGDGEYLCIYKYIYNDNSLISNCDNDTYTKNLSDKLCESLHNIVNYSNNNYIGKWNDDKIQKLFLSITTHPINYISYHSFIFDEYDIETNNIVNKINIFKEIKNSNRKKIYVCNKLLIKAKILLNINNIINIGYNNWFDKDYENIFNQIKKCIVGSEDNSIIMFSCGMGGKVLISELYKLYPNCTYIDIGSGLDIICTKRNTRGFKYKYDDLYQKFVKNDFIPNDWSHPKYDYIYDMALNKLGIHLPKNI